MAEESVRAAVAAVQKAVTDVEHYLQKIKEIKARPDFTGSEPQYHAFNDRLKEARAYHLSLTQGAPPVFTPSDDPFFSRIGTAREDKEKLMLTFPSPIPLTDKYELCIRDAYKVIYQAVVSKTDPMKRKYAIVTGTPGVGKSSFLYYVFWRMVQEKMRVFFVAQLTYFDGERLWDLSTMPTPQYGDFWKEDLWCLVDSADPTKIPGLHFHYCSILLTTTPCYDYLKEFKKLVPPPPVFYMPLWSLEELQSIVHLYRCDDVKDWRNRFVDLGGVPR